MNKSNTPAYALSGKKRAIVFTIAVLLVVGACVAFISAITRCSSNPAPPSADRSMAIINGTTHQADWASGHYLAGWSDGVREVDSVDPDTLCCQFKTGHWLGDPVFARGNGHATISPIGELMVNDAPTGRFPAVPYAPVAARTVRFLWRTVAVTDDARIEIYERDGVRVHSTNPLGRQQEVIGAHVFAVSTGHPLANKGDEPGMLAEVSIDTAGGGTYTAVVNVLTGELWPVR